MDRRGGWIFFEDYGALLAFVVAVVATLGSLYYSEVAGFVPCTLCWYQRILMYPLVAVTLVGVIRRDEYLPAYVLPLAVLGMGVSGYHVLVQNGLFSHPATCTAGVPCSLRYVNYLGFITIPLMALTAFALIAGIMVATWQAFRVAEWEEAAAPAPAAAVPGRAWQVVVGLVALVFVALALVAFRGGTALDTAGEIEAPVSGATLFAQATLDNAPGCIACHSLDADLELTGPSLAHIGREAAERVPGQSAATYLRESIVNPDAHVVEGFEPGVMYQQYGEALTGAEIAALVSYMLTLE